MAEPPAGAADPLSSPPIPPLTSSIFSDDLTLPDEFNLFDDEGFDITFDDFHLPSDTDEFLNSTVQYSNPFDLSSSDPEINDFVSDHETVVAESGNSSENHGSDVLQFLNIPSPDCSGEENLKSVRVLGDLLTDSGNENPVSSQSSGNCEFPSPESRSEACMDGMDCPSPDSGNSVVNQKVKRETASNFDLKRKNESSDVNSESRTMKYRRSNEASTVTENVNANANPDEKKKARLIRNRESAQLSRQRKKHYVEELEDKVRSMHATIQDLNARFTYLAAENASLKQQMVAVAGNNGVCPPPVMYPPHPAMGPMGSYPPWMMPSMPCPPYVVKSQGSQVPLVPIPRLKPQQSPSQKSKKVEVKKTKKLASISFLGLFLFIFLFCGLVPTMKVTLPVRDRVTDGVYSNKSSDYKLYNQQHHGRVLMNDDHRLNVSYGTGTGTNRNASEPLVASLYVPRNDKLVKIDGNLIIHSVLASEKAMASREDLVPAISIPTVNRNGGRQPHVYRSSSDHQRAVSTSKTENLKSKHADGKLQQWFREGLAGPMLSSGMCTEVFQFDVSAAIVPVVNITASKTRENRNFTVKNRRILHGLPIPLAGSTTNITKEQNEHKEVKEHHHKNESVSSMVVSVLVDPREAGDGGGDVVGMMGGGGGGGKGKSFSRIFVVVLKDSVKYVTYSCMLPLMGGSHLVTS